ncbi:MAG: HNH endonuclease [Ignavibacteriae bacterium]|nr:HNH endonuclease [Ignavibacteria bacterium]MBI3365654.1 HNH endonuclease [Ignavibacteriota bacterium]
MSRMNARKARAALLFVLKRDGCRCNNRDGRLFHNPQCKKTSDENSLLLDHIDNDPENNDPSNWQVLCRSCNTKKNGRGRSKRGERARAKVDNSHKMRLIEREGMSEETKPSSTEMKKSIEYRTKYRSWIINKVFREERVTEQEAIDGGSEHVECSQQAARRYLQQLSSSEGILAVEVVQEVKYVILKPEFASLSQEELANQYKKNWSEDLLKGMDITLSKAARDEMAERKEQT